jgi:hypothetical protein
MNSFGLASMIAGGNRIKQPNRFKSRNDIELPKQKETTAGIDKKEIAEIKVPDLDEVKPLKGEKSLENGLAEGTSKIDFVDETGRLGGKLYIEKDLKFLDNSLEKRGIILKVGDEFLPLGKGGGFNYNTGELILKSNPTQYELWLELSHYIQYKQIGKDTYSKLPRTSGPVPMNDLTKFNSPEQFVYDMLSNSPKRWNSLNHAEQLHANWYITQFGGVR